MRRIPIKNASNKSKNEKAPITKIRMSLRSVWMREEAFVFFIELGITETIADSLMSLDDVCSEFFSEITDIDFDDLLISPGIIDSPDSFCELSLG